MTAPGDATYSFWGAAPPRGLRQLSAPVFHNAGLLLSWTQASANFSLPSTQPQYPWKRTPHVRGGVDDFILTCWRALPTPTATHKCISKMQKWCKHRTRNITVLWFSGRKKTWSIQSFTRKIFAPPEIAMAQSTVDTTSTASAVESLVRVCVAGLFRSEPPFR
jgi:hypothetical protein